MSGCSYSPENEYAEQPNLNLGNMDCIQRFPNNLHSLLDTNIRKNNNSQNIVVSVNYFVPQPQS